MPANLTTKLGQLVDVLTPDTTNTRIGVANASPTRTLDVTGTGAISTSLAVGGATIGTNALAVTGTTALNAAVAINSIGSSSLVLNSTEVTAASRNWGFRTNDAAYGDFSIKQSNAQYGDPLSGTVRLNISPTGLVGIGTTTPTKALDVSNATQRNQIAMSGTNVVAIRWNSTDPNGSERNWEISNNIDQQGAMSFRTGATQGSDPTTTRMMINNSGSLLVGTTTANGAISNGAPVSAGGFSTVNSTVSLTANTAATLVTIPSGSRSSFLVSICLNVVDAGNYGAAAIIVVDNSSASLTTIKVGALMTLSMSGLNIQATTTVTSLAYFSVIRLMSH